MIESKEDTSLIAHLFDLRDKSEIWHTNLYSGFLNEQQQAVAQKYFPASILSSMMVVIPVPQKEESFSKVLWKMAFMIL